MSSDRIAACFLDIVAATDLIDAWVNQAGGVDQAVYHNVLVRNAVERQLLVISEAAIRLNKIDASAAESLAPDIDWSGIRGIGNFIRHKYDDLDARIIADVLQHRLASLRAAAQMALETLGEGD